MISDEHHVLFFSSRFNYWFLKSGTYFKHLKDCFQLLISEINQLLIWFMLFWFMKSVTDLFLKSITALFVLLCFFFDVSIISLCNTFSIQPLILVYAIAFANDFSYCVCCFSLWCFPCNWTPTWIIVEIVDTLHVKEKGMRLKMI